MSLIEATPHTSTALTRGFVQFLALIGGNSLIGYAVAPFLPVYFQELGLTGLHTGIYFALTTVASVLLALPVGVSSDRMRIAGILVVGLALMAVNNIGFLATRTFTWF